MSAIGQRWFKPKVGAKVWFKMYFSKDADWWEGTVKWCEKVGKVYNIDIERNGRVHYGVDRCQIKTRET